MTTHLLRADIVVGEVGWLDDAGIMQVQEVGVPALVHLTENIVWVDKRAFPIGPLGLQMAVIRLTEIMKAAMQYWPDVASATDWSITFSNFEVGAKPKIGFTA